MTVTAGNDADTTNDMVSLSHSAASGDSAYQGITIAGLTVTANDTAQVLGVMITDAECAGRLQPSSRTRGRAGRHHESGEAAVPAIPGEPQDRPGALLQVSPGRKGC